MSATLLNDNYWKITAVVIIIGLSVGLFAKTSDRRLCDRQCNLAYCACVETCPQHRGRGE